MSAFRQRLASGVPQIGLWQALANAYTAEICAGAGFDWLLFDGEHAPNTLQTLIAQLQAVSAYPVEPVARVPVGDPAIIKQYLDIGFRTLLVPMVESADQARMLVAATRFPPRGIRGVASATSRASGFGANADFLAKAHEEICLLVQIESKTAVDALPEIAAVDGVDGLFVGPSDLAASLGHLGDPRNPAVQAVIAQVIRQVKQAGKFSGIFGLDAADARDKIALGVSFVSVGTDIGLLAKSCRDLRGELGD